MTNPHSLNKLFHSQQQSPSFVGGALAKPVWSTLSKSALGENSPLEILGFLKYQQPIRGTVVSAKVHGNLYKIKEICDAIAVDPLLCLIMSLADVVVPIPHSGWSRLRGRPHLPSAMLSQLKVCAKVKHPSVRFPLGQVLQTKSLLNSGLINKRTNEERSRLLRCDVDLDKIGWFHMSGSRAIRPRVVLFDDVTTSGETFANYCLQMEKRFADVNPQFLCVSIFYS